MKSKKPSYLSSLLKSLLAMSSVAIVSGCANSFKDMKENDPYWAPALPTVNDSRNSETGSIYNPASAQMLFQDKKALRIGDIVTVVLTENTNASKTADTEVTKDSQITMPQVSAFGRDLNIGGDNPLVVTVPAQNRTFAGEADSTQTNRLQGTITVTVHQVYPNGNLMVKGEKWISLNQGSEFIRIAGIIRPEDIDKDNQVISTRVANAKISYGGEGPLADANRPGWLTRFFSSDWWPF
ncbi:flagellar basal body L-ring protein FlgH [Aliikangiella marina]|uniref:Flagellar L-ring protein n=1 Tax=Aliikangiella marina TaxID=1712262 RepID=A0A545TDK9_9GAMM|nr:flagellar basal body L-ring protein FlgH [Aliikangiella marina]TQV75308.1 flagellar basal body L-ring protein FlgH [Aliikangiella marina]